MRLSFWGFPFFFFAKVVYDETLITGASVHRRRRHFLDHDARLSDGRFHRAVESHTDYTRTDCHTDWARNFYTRASNACANPNARRGKSQTCRATAAAPHHACADGAPGTTTDSHSGANRAAAANTRPVRRFLLSSGQSGVRHCAEYPH